MSRQAMRAVGFFFLCIWLAGVVSAADPAAEAMKQLKTSIDRVLEVLNDKELAKPEHEADRRKSITEIIKSRFDFEEMAKRAMSRHWKDQTPEQAKSFVDLFTELLSASYIGKIEAYTDENVLYHDAMKKGPYIWIKTTIKGKDVNVPVEYRMFSRDGEWFVYDVVIEEVSLVSTYRDQFNQTISRESYDALVKKLQNKLNEIEALEKAGKPA
ncbi:MAG: ABC transporter substrate-binding protein [Deltaproteobacteria bacterium]|nr:ABC transporter substrate-binding protein [Deltaproteobacteria bacterium]